jgi:hypothetical protein
MMKNLSIAIVATLSLLSFAGCKKSGGGSNAVAKYTEFKDQMCKCTDKACADKVTEAMTKWTQDFQKESSGDKAAKASEEDTKKMTSIMEDLAKCQAKVMAAAAPPPPPAGDKPADPNAPPPAGDKPADPNAPAAGGTPPPAGDKPPAGSN